MVADRTRNRDRNSVAIPMIIDCAIGQRTPVESQYLFAVSRLHEQRTGRALYIGWVCRHAEFMHEPPHIVHEARILPPRIARPKPDCEMRMSRDGNMGNRRHRTSRNESALYRFPI